MYSSGLIMKRVASHSIIAVPRAPKDILPFIRAPFICNISSFSPWAHQFAQDNIRPHQRIKIESGEQKGIVGQAHAINDSVVTIVPESDELAPPFDIPLCALSPLYLLGDSVKDRWSDSHGLVVNIDEEQRILVYLEKDSVNEITTPMDAVEPFEPPRCFYHFKKGDWVTFKQPMDRECRGHIKHVTDAHALVADEHTSAEYDIDTRDLEICEVQGPSLPKGDPVHTLVGQDVLVSGGPLKGFYGRIKDVGSDTVIVELEAKVASSRSSCQPIKRSHVTLVPDTVQKARCSTDIRTRTPSPPPNLIPPRDQTPDLTPDHPHWIFSPPIHLILHLQIIPFNIKNTHISGDGALGEYEGYVARTVPIDRSNIVPREGEIVVNVVKRSRRKQFSINPAYLVPLVPVVGSDVVVINDTYLGVVSVVKAQEDKMWVVTFPFDPSREHRFEDKDLAMLEGLT